MGDPLRDGHLSLAQRRGDWGGYPIPPPSPDLQIPAAYLDFFSWTLGFAIFPRRGCHLLSAASGADDKVNAWQWIYERVMTGVRDPGGFHRDSVDATGVIAAQHFYRIGDCQLPINVGPSAATQLFVMRKIVSDLRIRINLQGMDSPNPECREYCEVVKRNVDRARKRLTVGRARLRAATGSDIRDGKGNTARGPSDDDLAPPVSAETLAAHPLFPALGPTWSI